MLCLGCDRGRVYGVYKHVLQAGHREAKVKVFYDTVQQQEHGVTMGGITMNEWMAWGLQEFYGYRFSGRRNRALSHYKGAEGSSCLSHLPALVFRPTHEYIQCI